MVLYASHYIKVLEGSNEQDTKLIFCFTDPATVGLDLHFWKEFCMRIPTLWVVCVFVRSVGSCDNHGHGKKVGQL